MGGGHLLGRIRYLLWSISVINLCIDVDILPQLVHFPDRLIIIGVACTRYSEHSDMLVCLPV